MATSDMREPAADRAHGLGKIDRLGGEIDPENTDQFAPTQEWCPVHLHGALVGFVIALPSGHEAITANWQDIGRYNTSQAAANALVARAGACCDG